MTLSSRVKRLERTRREEGGEAPVLIITRRPPAQRRQGHTLYLAPEEYEPYAREHRFGPVIGDLSDLRGLKDGETITLLTIGGEGYDAQR